MSEIRRGIRGGPETSPVRFVIEIDTKERLVEDAKSQGIELSELLRDIVDEHYHRLDTPSKPRRRA